MLERRRAVYRNKGRSSPDWNELKAKTTDMMANAKKRFYDREAEQLMANGAHRIAYCAVDGLGYAEGKKPWNIMDMRPGKTEKDIAEELADGYSKISQEFPPLVEDTFPTTYDREVIDLTEQQVYDRLTAIKKPKSNVTIDIPGKLVNRCATHLAPLLTRLINKIRSGERWPLIWSSEEVTTIPKVKNPESFDQCRGISCTSIFSKLAESFMLDQMQEELGVANNQYGGLRGHTSLEKVLTATKSPMSMLGTKKMLRIS